MSKAPSTICPCLAVDTLAVLPFAERIRAYDDFDAALVHWRSARHARRFGMWGWQLDMRRALRFWRHYATAVRKARNRRIAA